MKQFIISLLAVQAFLFVSHFSLSAQGQIRITRQQDSLSTLKLDSLDILYGLAGDTVSGHPYYTFLWIFGDGTFINGTRDSIVSHIYEQRAKRNYYLGGAAGGAAETTVYATGNYSGGTRRPKKLMAPPGNPFRYPTVMRQTFKLPALGRLDLTPTPAVLPSVIDTTKTGTLRLQLSNKIRPQDTLVSILSFRQPRKAPVQPISGQLLLFYNSKVKKANRVDNTTKKLFKNTAPPPPPPALSFGKFNLQRQMVHFTNIAGQSVADLTGQGITEFKNVIGFDYDSLSTDGTDERHLFIEFQNDSLMWQLFKNNIGDTLKFLAVMTALSNNTDILGQLPTVQSAYLNQTGIQNLLQTNFFADGTFINLGQSNNLQAKIIGVSEVVSPVVAAHDPNNLTIYACECPDPAEKKIAGVIDFSNDGKADTRQLSVTLHVPDQLNLSSVESISLSPAPLASVQPQIDLAARTVTWTWSALLYPAESAGYGHSSTQGQIVFSMALKDGADLNAVEPLTACIVFDMNDPMCTLPAERAAFITSYQEDGSDFLQCDECKNYPDEGKETGIDWKCLLLWALGIFLLLLIIWLVRRFLS
jgi:hypothetical protein